MSWKNEWNNLDHHSSYYYDILLYHLFRFVKNTHILFYKVYYLLDSQNFLFIIILLRFITILNSQ